MSASTRTPSPRSTVQKKAGQQAHGPEVLLRYHHLRDLGLTIAEASRLARPRPRGRQKAENAQALGARLTHPLELERKAGRKGERPELPKALRKALSDGVLLALADAEKWQIENVHRLCSPVRRALEKHYAAKLKDSGANPARIRQAATTAASMGLTVTDSALALILSDLAEGDAPYVAPTREENAAHRARAALRKQYEAIQVEHRKTKGRPFGYDSPSPPKLTPERWDAILDGVSQETRDRWAKDHAERARMLAEAAEARPRKKKA